MTTTATKLNAREQLVAFVIDRGWELDPTKTKWSDYVLDGRAVSGNRERVQDPHCFRRADGDGGFWTLELDFSAASDFRKTTNRLRRAHFRHENAEGALVNVGPRDFHNHITVEPRDSWAGGLDAAVWSVTEGVTGTNSLRQRVELIVVDPALVVWLASEKIIDRARQVKEDEARRKALAAARKRPLAVTVPQDDFRHLVLALDKAVGVLRRADGTTDLTQAVVDAHIALAAVNAVVPAPTTVG